MPRSLPVLVAVLLAVTAVASGGPVSVATGPATPADSTVRPQLQNTTNNLGLSGQRRGARFGNATLDVAATAAMERGQLQTAFNETTTLQQFDGTVNTTRRTVIIERAADTIENQTAVQQRRQRDAVAAYNDGEITTEQFIQRLAVIDAESQRLHTFIERLLERADQTPGYSLPNSLRTRLNSLQSTPVILQGTIQTSAARTLSGESGAFSVYVETTDDGYVLARLDGNRYLREAYLASEYQQPGVDQFTERDKTPISAAYERARELYPWTFTHLISRPSATGYGETSVYRIGIDHAQGSLVSYIDGTTTNVFRETQDLRLSRLPITATATNNTTDLRIRANLTYESGPMNVTVTHNDTAEPVDARLAVNDYFVGQTGRDGNRWTIRPHGPVRINATTSAGEAVTLQLPAEG